jgi:hypothetical protein
VTVGAINEHTVQITDDDCKYWWFWENVE